MANTSRKRSRRTGPMGTPGVQDLVEGGQQIISEAQGRAEDAAKRVRHSVQDAVNTLEKRRDVELKNLRARLRDLNTSLGGLERRYRTLEKRLTKQVETLSGRTVKASDLDRRLRALETEIRRATGIGVSARKPAAKRATVRRPAAKPTTARKPAAKQTAARKPAAKRTAARKPAAKRTTTRRPAAKPTTTAR